MSAFLSKLAAPLTSRIGVAAVIIVVGLGVHAFWLYARDPIDFDGHRLELLQRFSGEQKQLQAALADVQERIARLETGRTAQQERLRTADRLLAALRADDSWWRTVWAKLFGDSAEVRTKEERQARLEKMKNDATARVAELRELITRATWERDGVEIALGRVNQNLAEVERDRSKTAHYLSQAWQRSRWYVILALAAWFLAPALWHQWRQSRRSGSETGNPVS